MNFNLVGTLLAVSSAHDTVHIFKLGNRGKGGNTGGSSSSASVASIGSGAVSPPESLDGHMSPQGLDGGYDAYVEKKKSSSVSCVSLLILGDIGLYVFFFPRSSLRKKSLQMTKSLSHSVGGYLPNTLTEMWEPTRDFAFLKLPTSGARTIVALSGYLSTFFHETLYMLNG
jgi:autophagy-related protein 18